MEFNKTKFTEQYNNDIRKTKLAANQYNYSTMSRLIWINVPLISAGADHSLVYRLLVPHSGQFPCLFGRERRQCTVWNLRWRTLVGTGEAKTHYNTHTDGGRCWECRAVLLTWCGGHNICLMSSVNRVLTGGCVRLQRVMRQDDGSSDGSWERKRKESSVVLVPGLFSNGWSCLWIVNWKYIF